MKRKNSESGILAVEASIVLSFLIFFMLFIWNFSGVFAAQNAVAHSSLQATQTIASDNMGRALIKSKNSTTVQNTQDFAGFVNKVLDFLNVDGSTRARDLGPFDESGAKQRIYEALFYHYIGGEEVAKGLGIENVSFEFDEALLSAGTLNVKVTYDVKLQFGVFGLDKMTFVKYSSCKLFGAG